MRDHIHDYQPPTEHSQTDRETRAIEAISKVLYDVGCEIERIADALEEMEGQ